MKFIIPIESIVENKGGVILYDPHENKILKQYVHDKKWKRVGWRGGVIHDEYLIATDWTDLHYFNIKKWKLMNTFKKNTFNDLHYLEIFDGHLYVVNTGLDAIEIFSDPMTPKLEEMIFIFERNKKLFTQRKFDLKEAFNDKYKFKPHSCHPNCISFRRDAMFVTCFEKHHKINSGELIELNSGKRVAKGHFDCHDGNFHHGQFYMTRTRHSSILVFENLTEKKWPTKPDRTINIGKPGWWRGMVLHGDNLYVFSSDGYRKRKSKIRMALVNLKTNKVKIKTLPVVDGVYWDTVYQPQLWEK